jgi:4-hydroxy-3-polyprenylbenzoate decarboxylase
LLEIIQALPDVESHLVLSTAAATTIPLETEYTPEEVRALATVDYRFKDIAAAISSGSFRTDGMIVLPCSMKTLSAIAYSYSDNLLTRAADVVLKERRKLILCPRETPLHLGHLRAMTLAAEMGAIIAPSMPAFYHRPQTVDDIINQTVNRVLDLVDVTLPEDLFRRWEGGGRLRD